MTTLTSALNYGALITLSCCNAVLQIAAAPVCTDPAQDTNWPACASSGDNVGREWGIDGDRVCRQYDPGNRSQTDCGVLEVLRGKLYLVEAKGRRMPVDTIQGHAQ